VQSLVSLKLLAEVKMDSSLEKLELLFERGMIESLVKLVFLPQEEKLLFRGRDLHRLIHQCFFCK
jgi:hypothetical protein